ncbi:hypothetical protein [Bradyrhizobium sp. JYMT SZCCT0428]|uniref:hypothetical protein n=1 Tax=Bradyrhizobium sp. JYMT SZCCT0428 TaxID=2807673 RepID=UPI001BA686A9|nr:hypothetical protein [Bradyrhizobium sp. JYMT SZCCT0428]MBR1157188.1 hypothetical protein [Bradyrhizobium sp. JYMT SZCCT0428]
MGTKTKSGFTGDLHLIMSHVHALVEMTVASDENGDIAMTPAILDQVRVIPGCSLDAFGLKRGPIIPPGT